MGRLLVHLHLFYQDQADYFLNRLSNITVPFRLIVTLTQDNGSIRKRILSCFPDAVILVVKNCGYDVYPFFQAMKQVDLSSFDYVLKIHTKNKRNKLSLNHLHYRGYGFRDNLVTPLIGSRQYFETALSTLCESPGTGMVCPRFFLVRKEAPNNREYTVKLCSDYGIPYDEEAVFCAGTMFLCRAQIIRFLLRNDYSASDYGNRLKTGSVGSLAHSMETMFGIVCRHLGYEVKGLKGSSRYYSWVFFWKYITHRDIRWLRNR